MPPPPDRQRLEQALRAAHAAGDKAAATQLAQAIRGTPQAFMGPIATGQEMADSRKAASGPTKTEEVMRKLGLISAGVGLGEAALSVGTGMVSAPANSLWNAGMEALELPPGEPVGTYMPRSEGGKAVLAGAGKLVQPLASLIERGTDINNPNPAVRATGHLINAGLGIAPAVGSLRAAKAGRAAIPTRPEIRTAANAAYQRAEQAGGMLPQGNLGGFVQQAEQVLLKEGFDQQLNPKTYAAVMRFMDEATKPGIAGHSPQGAEILRRVLLNAEKEAALGSQDAMLAGKLVDEFDDFMDKQLPAAAGQYADARLLWQTQRKAQDIETLFERARNQSGQFSMSGMENALRTQFKQLADNPRRFGRFSPDEKAAILEVVRGGPAQHALRLVGKFAPTGVVPGIAALSAEGVAPGAGFALAGAGLAGRAGAAALRNRSARRVDELVRSGAMPAMPQSRLGTRGTPQLGYLPANALAVDQATQERRNALAK
jgi:hypothetical protein